MVKIANDVIVRIRTS